MEAMFLSMLLGLVVSLLTWFSDSIKVPTRIILIVFSLAVTLIVKFWFHMSWDSLIAGSWETLGSAAGLYALLSKPAAKAIENFFGKKK